MTSSVVSDNFETSTGAIPTLGGDSVETRLCRAWVNFNGTGTVAIRGSYNVSSITDNGTGDYTISFTTAMSDVNYVVTGFGARAASDSFSRVPTFTDGDTKSTSAFQFYMITTGASSASDVAECNLAIFR